MFDKAQLMGMASSMLPQMVLGNFGSVLIGAIAAYYVMYFFAGPDRFFYRVGALIVVQAVAYAMTFIVSRSITYVTRWIQGHTGIGGMTRGTASTAEAKKATTAADTME